MERGHVVAWLQMDLLGLFPAPGHLFRQGRRKLLSSLLQPFLGKLVFWIQIKCRAEFGGSPHARILQQQSVPALNVIEDQLRSQYFARSQILPILWNQPRRFIELCEGLLKPLIFVQLDAPLEGFLRVLEVLLGREATDSARNSIAANRRRCRRGFVSQRERHSNRRGQ